MGNLGGLKYLVALESLMLSWLNELRFHESEEEEEELGEKDVTTMPHK